MSNPEDLKFVNISHPSDIRRSRDIQTEIRRHVMRDRREQRPRQRPSEDEAAHESYPSRTDLIPQPPHPEVALSLTSLEQRPNPLYPSLAPLGSFPLSSNMRSFELVRFLNEGINVYNPFREIWFQLSLTDTGAFHVTLGNAAFFLETYHENENPMNTEVRKHYYSSLAHLQRRLSNIDEGIKEGTIANILALVCLNLRVRDFQSLKVHLNGLELIWRARGGFTDLSDNFNILIFLYDLAVSMMLGTIPRFPVPQNVAFEQSSLRDMPQRLRSLLVRLTNPEFAPAVTALALVSSIANTVNLKSHSVSFWQRGVEAITLIGPCIHYLLSMPKLSVPDETELSSSSVAREMIRLVCLMLMSKLKEAFSMTAHERSQQEMAFVGLMSEHFHLLSSEYSELKIWALVTATLLQHRSGREPYIYALLGDLQVTSDQFANAVIETARETLWVNAIESPSTDELVEDIVRLAAPIHDHPVTLPLEVFGEIDATDRSET